MSNAVKTPAAWAEEILKAIEPVLPVPLTEARKFMVVESILTVVNPLCNELEKLRVAATWACYD